jgi:hypothetical protein
MAVVNLQPYNNIALALTTATQLVPPPPNGPRWNLTLVAPAAGIYVKNANTVSASDAASFELPANVPITFVVAAPAGLWVYASAAGPLGALLTPRGE